LRQVYKSAALARLSYVTSCALMMLRFIK
jgi:hypothetical protein